ncbi:MAG: NADH-quinone oxidoreductase subunit NuoF [Erysipelotrichaceae bacterium]|jgi:NADH:ubiquinone oxidoreductase subunit F (NADH-binding)/(2Fe-2S) ferredoxin/NAD-dependent dihydropyrimidine dehydrogenase PreA subunit|nr:NADH-quinone oxidoreductase subunit NuoF [Erysipelotrichaceae bacterium]
MIEKIKTEAQLKDKIKSCESCLKDKFAGNDGKRHIVVCGGTGCLSSDSALIISTLEDLIKAKGLEDKVTVNKVGCFGFCSQGPFVKIYPEDRLYRMVKVKDCERLIEEDIIGGEVIEDLLYEDPHTHEKVEKQDQINFYKKQLRIALHGCSIINPEVLDEALGYDAFKALIKVLSMSQQEVINEVLTSGLRGRGGAGFPTGRKWQFAYDQVNDEKYVVCNGDEGDPGAFMDRSILEGNPVGVIEGMMIAGYAIGAKNGYFYVRAEYPIAVERLQIAIKELEEVGLLGDNILGSGFSFRCHIRLGAGAFVCGEETALLNSIEGKRGMPRPRPPFPAIKGLWGKPTIINNVETLADVPYIIRIGGAEFAKIGTEKSKGTKVFALGGKVNNVGLVEVPMGTTLRELIYDIGGGIPGDKKFKAIQTGGPSGGCLTEKDLDVPIDYDSLVARGSMMGSGGAIVMDEDNCMVDVAKFYMEFICDESCGKCTPCRVGTKRMLEILTKICDGKGTSRDLEDLKALAEVTKTNSLCALGQTAANPIISTMTAFENEYKEHVVDKVCEAHVCKSMLQYVISPEKCKKCSVCARNCPVGAISGEVGKTVYVIDQNKCIKCGLCYTACRFKAIDKK